MSRARKKVILDAEKEAERIFVKNNQKGPMTKYKNRVTGLYPKVDRHSPNAYREETERVEDQVVATRLANYKKNKKRKTAEQIFKGMDNAFSYIKRKKI